MIKLEHCCCGCKLRTGTIAFLTLKVSFAAYQLYLILQDMRKNDLSEVEPARFRYIAYNFTSAVVMIVACCTGIRVITKDRAKFLVPFICCQFVLFICYSVFILWFWFSESFYMTELLDEASKFILDEKTKNIVDTFLKHKPYIYIATMFSFLGLNIYFTIVVYNYCVKLRREYTHGCPDALTSRTEPEEVEFVFMRT